MSNPIHDGNARQVFEGLASPHGVVTLSTLTQCGVCAAEIGVDPETHPPLHELIFTTADVGEYALGLVGLLSEMHDALRSRSTPESCVALLNRVRAITGGVG